VLEIPGNGEEELAGLYGVEEVAEAGREEESWHRVDQVHAEHRQTIRPDRQTVRSRKKDGRNKLTDVHAIHNGHIK
jgi:hypothetical protein